ncbi:hypothetical protein HPB48_026723 [Haemaphysalis longicornis]|uniref:Uncharacterized protein n=1 Tax=Haemaphysalis longicornis TaxID=44386 RepID=A0A9J6HCX2_HAELO|nr:hypothetical protein HPB48_026723 [Haemaphysalis longicornis]
MKYRKSSEWRKLASVLVTSCAPWNTERGVLPELDEVHPNHAYPSGRLRGTRPFEVLQKDMFSFLQEYEELYGENRLTFNEHALLHLVDCIREWGPLWNVSAYSYEGVNGRLVRLVNGTRHAHLQIAEKFLILSTMPRLCAERLRPSSTI